MTAARPPRRPHLRCYFVGADGVLPAPQTLSTGVTAAYMLPNTRFRASACCDSASKRMEAAALMLRHNRQHARWCGGPPLSAVVLVRCRPRLEGKHARHPEASAEYAASFAVCSARHQRIVCSEVETTTLWQTQQNVQSRIRHILDGDAAADRWALAEEDDSAS